MKTMTTGACLGEDDPIIQRINRDNDAYLRALGDAQVDPVVGSAWECAEYGPGWTVRGVVNGAVDIRNEGGERITVFRGFWPGEWLAVDQKEEETR